MKKIKVIVYDRNFPTTEQQEFPNWMDLLSSQNNNNKKEKNPHQCTLWWIPRIIETDKNYKYFRNF